MAEVIKQDPTVIDYQVYVGTASPYNFNGLVRHYFMRSGPTVADIQVNLLPKHPRNLKSHDIAKRVSPCSSLSPKTMVHRWRLLKYPLDLLFCRLWLPRSTEQVKRTG